MENPDVHKKANPVEPEIRHKRARREYLHSKHRPKTCQSSKLTNGSALLPKLEARCTDGRSAWCRRLRDLLESHVNQLGGWPAVSHSEAVIIRRCATLTLELERRESAFARAGEIDDSSLAIYATASNSLRRLLEAIGLHRRARDITRPLADILKEIDAEPKPEPATEAEVTP